MKKRVLLLTVATLLIAVLLCSCSGEAGKLVIDNNNVTMTVGDTYVVNVVSSEAKEALTWSSSDDSVASVDDGTITANGEGSATITVMSFKGLKEVCNVKVVGIEITKVSLDTTATVVDKGKCVQLNASVYPTEANSDSLEWSSSDDSVASVDSEGYVSGLKAGTAVIKCTAPNGKTASCTVTVKGKDSSSSNNSKNSGGTINNYYNNNGGRVIEDTTLYCRASDYATLRSAPSRSAKEVAKVYSRESVQCISSSTEYYYVVYQGQRGYVLKDYFSTNPSAPLNYGIN